MFTRPENNLENFKIDHGQIVADFGAGIGAYSLAMARQVGDSGKVYAIDVQKDLLGRLSKEASRLKISNIEVIWGDVEKVGGSKLPDRSVDLVLISNILFQSHAKYSILKEAKRILKPGGRLVIIDWEDSFNNLGPEQGAIIKPEELEKILIDLGLKILKKFKAGDHHYGLVTTL